MIGIATTAALTAAMVGCASQQVGVRDEVLPFEQAIGAATDMLLGQEGEGLLGQLSLARKSVVLDPTLDTATGQQTVATQRLDRLVADRLSAAGGRLQVVPFESANLSKVPYLLAATMTRAPAAYRIHMALVALPSGAVVAQASALAAEAGVDMSPLSYDRDSPVLLKDNVSDGHVRTSSTPRGGKADGAYLERLVTTSAIHNATALYNAERYREALNAYRSVQATPSGDQIRVLNGIYLSQLKLGQAAEAEEAFGRLAAYGMAHNTLSVKFLFNPGTTDFWSDPKVSSAYAMWLRQIARQGASAKVCVEIVGHTSKTGPEGVNDMLSLRRATYIKQRLSSESPQWGGRIRAKGLGSRSNIVGSGSDDVVDALDRRVEFVMVECGRPAAPSL